MSLLKAFSARSQSIFRARAAETRMDEEFGFHVEMETKRLIDRGVSRRSASPSVVTMMRGRLDGLSPHDPLTFVSVPLVLGLVVLVATYLRRHGSRRSASERLGRT